MRWSEPSLVEFEFFFGARRRSGLARLGFPHLQEGDREWSCAFQVRGVKDGRIRLARGVDGFQALTIATAELRKSLDELKPIGPNGEAHEFIFPRIVPSTYGLEFHLKLCRLIDAETKKEERRIHRRLHDDKKSS
jgi:hypothetical protein